METTTNCLILVLVCIFTDKVSCCGITTHTVIAHRAIEYFQDKRGNVDFQQVILENQDAFQAANAYPDSFWPKLCRGGKFHYVSEDTHWAPFIKTTIDYIRERYPQPWDRETRKLVAFLLGFSSHQVADVVWHSLGISQGFLSTMGDINFFGSFPDAHQVGDLGSDVLVESELNLDFIAGLSDWYIPVKDLYEIYKRYFNGTVIMHEDVILECSSLLFLERLGEKSKIFSELYGYISQKTTFQVEELESYFLGGVDQMALLTQTVWHKAILMLEKGTSVCDIPHSAIYINCSGNGPSNSGVSRSIWDESTRGPRYKGGRISHDLDMSDVNVTVTERGVYLSPSASLKTRLISSLEIMRDEHLIKKNLSTATKDPVTKFHVKNKFARLGWSIATGDINGDHNEDLIVGAPGYGLDGLAQIGRVYIIYGTQKNMEKGSPDLDQDADIILEGFHKGGKFGSAVAALDLNLDGFTDVVVSAPSVGSENLTFRGEVYVFFGSAGGQLSNIPNVTISCVLKYCNFGWTLATGFHNNHPNLMIGSPFAPAYGVHQVGMVSILHASSIFKNASNLHLTEVDMDITLRGDQEYGWYGHQISQRRNKLVVSQPTYRICANSNCSYSHNDVQSVGSMSIKDLDQNTTYRLEGQERFEKLGASVALGDPFGNGSLVLAIASDTKAVSGKITAIPTEFPQAGKVHLYDVQFVQGKFERHPDKMTRSRVGNKYGYTAHLEKFSTYEGDRRFGRFGGEVRFEDVTGDGIDDFVISAPFRTEDITGQTFKVEEGSVYVYKGGASFDVGDVTNQCHLLTTIKPCPADKAYAVLSSGESGSRFGSKVAAWTFNEKTHLVVSAPRSSESKRLAGGIYVYNL